MSAILLAYYVMGMTTLPLWKCLLPCIIGTFLGAFLNLIKKAIEEEMKKG